MLVPIVLSQTRRMMATSKVSIECVDNRSGFLGVVVYDAKAFRFPIHQGPVYSDVRGPHSSVRVFLWDHYRTNTLMPWAPLVTVRDSNTSVLNVAPSGSSKDEEAMEVDLQV